MSEWLTDEHHDWVAQVCGVDPRTYAAPGGGPAVEGGLQEGAAAGVSAPPLPAPAAAVAARAEMAVNPAATSADAPGAGEDEADQPSLFDKATNFAKDAAAVATGAFVHAAAGVIPGGVVAATAIDAEFAAKADPERRFWYGAGSVAAGIADGAAAVGEIGGGVLAAGPTGGLSLAISAEGANEAAVSAEAVTAGLAMMATGSAGGGNGGGGRRPNKNAGKSVGEILKGKKGSIRNAPLEAGSPS